MKVLNAKLGQLRPSQLLHTFGVGAIVDLPHLSVMVMGLDDWDQNQAMPIREDRLLAQVQKRLGAQVASLRLPPFPPESQGLFRAADNAVPIGVPVAPFPRWLRCPACNLLARVNSGLFKLSTTPGRPDQARYMHETCTKKKMPSALPARFLLACPAGHLDDFPWDWFVHRGQTACRGLLELTESGVTGEATGVLVRCRECLNKRSMAEAFGREGAQNLPPCRARRPHLRDFEDKQCRERAHAILLGASNSWFADSLSVLYVPASSNTALAQLVEEHWTVLADVDDAVVLRFLRKQGKLAVFGAESDEDIWQAIDARRTSTPKEVADLRQPEWEAFTRKTGIPSNADFLIREVTAPAPYRRWISRVILGERLRSVTALTGFTRIASPRDFAEEEERPSRVVAPLSRNAPTFVPATEVRGEGIFLQFNEETLALWCSQQAVREQAYETANTQWRRRRGIEPPEAGCPGFRYIVLHTFAHAFMRALALECGYAAASLTERIYARDEGPDGPAMAGVLIYTAAPDAEGTLGGLVRMGEPVELERHLARTLQEMRLCSSDPLCAEHQPDPDGSTLHGAACHACLFAPETSCERGNRYLDRTVLVPTVSGLASFFDELPK